MQNNKNSLEFKKNQFFLKYISSENKKFSEKLKSYISHHPIISFHLFALVGGLILILYFFKIKFLPILKIEDFLFLFIVSGVVGIIVTAICIVTMIYPSIVFESFKLKDLTESSSFSKKNDELDFKRNLFVIPSLAFLISSVSIIYLNDALINDKFVSSFLLFIVNFIFIRWIFIFTMKKIKINFNYKHFRRYFITLFFSLLFYMFSFIIAYAILKNSQQLGESEFLFIINLIMFMLFLPMIYILENVVYKRFFYSLGLFLAFMIVFKTYFIIPYAVVKSFNLGQVKINTLYLNKEACEVFKKKIVNNQCEVNNIKLIWRLGESFVIETLNEAQDKSLERYYLNSKDIKSWKNEIENNTKEKKE